MKKALLATALGLTLAAGSALAQTSATPRVVDRIGAAPGEAEEFAGGVPAGLIFAAATVAAFLALDAVADDDDSESD